jgi:hypothetical protein
MDIGSLLTIGILMKCEKKIKILINIEKHKDRLGAIGSSMAMQLKGSNCTTHTF